MKNNSCYCGNVSPEIRQETRIISIEGKEYPLVEQYSYCVRCNRDWVTPEQLQDSLNKVTSIKRRAQGFLAPEDIKALREKHGLTQKEAAAIFGGGDNAFSKYERGEVYPTAAMDKLMQLFDNVPQAKNYLLANDKENRHLSSIAFFNIRNETKVRQINIRTLERLNLDKRESSNEIRRYHSTI